MKKLVLIPITALTICCLFLVAARAQDDAGVRKELEAQYKRLADGNDSKT